jgi:hypothetical protein
MTMEQQITPQLARELWDQTPHNWNDFCQILRSDPGRFGNLDASFRDRLCTLAERMQVEGNGFPTSPEALFHELVNQLGLYSRS